MNNGDQLRGLINKLSTDGLVDLIDIHVYMFVCYAIKKGFLQLISLVVHYKSAIFIVLLKAMVLYCFSTVQLLL